MKATKPGAPFAPTHTLLAGWGYDDTSQGFPAFRRATADTPVRVDPKQHARPGHSIAYNEAGARLHVTNKSLQEKPGETGKLE
jgi:hypothetical protein